MQVFIKAQTSGQVTSDLYCFCSQFDIIKDTTAKL